MDSFGDYFLMPIADHDRSFSLKIDELIYSIIGPGGVREWSAAERKHAEGCFISLDFQILPYIHEDKFIFRRDHPSRLGI